MKQPIENVDYTFVDVEKSEFTGIKILRSPFENVVYTYNVVSLEEAGDDYKLHMMFKIHECGEYTEQELEEEIEFKNLIGDILVELIMTGEMKTHEQIRKDNSKESDLQ